MSKSVTEADLKSAAEKLVGSSPTWGTIIMNFVTNNTSALEAHKRLASVLVAKVYKPLNIVDTPSSMEGVERRFTLKNSPYGCIYCKTTDPSQFLHNTKTVCRPCKNYIQNERKKAMRKQKRLEALEGK